MIGEISRTHHILILPKCKDNRERQFYDAIGIIICKEKNRTIVEYSLKTSTLPIGVATYRLTQDLPENLQQFLPDSQSIADRVDDFLAQYPKERSSTI